MNQRVFTFADQKIMSEGASGGQDIINNLRAHFPHAVKVEKARLAEDKQGIDYTIHLPNNKIQAVDLKARGEDYSRKQPPQDDYTLEIWSDIGKKVGWTRDLNKLTDYIYWLWQDTGRWSLVPFPMLRKVFIDHWKEWSKEYKTAIQPNAGPHGNTWNSQCVFVPRIIVWRKIYTSFSGIVAPDHVVRQMEQAL
jgi:hypothetical protein